MFPIKRVPGIIFAVFLMRGGFSEKMAQSLGIKERLYSSRFFGF
jgi:hypothetical protein